MELMREDPHSVQTPVRKYVVYDPPQEGLPYVAVLFQPDAAPRAFIFPTAEEATSFLTSNALPLSDRAV